MLEVLRTHLQYDRLIMTLKKYRLFIYLALVLRVGYSVWMAIFWSIVDKSFPLTDKALWETYHLLSRSPTLIGRSLIDVWLRWDAVHYMNIAEFGYLRVGEGETIFFPLYPYLVGFISHITSINITLIGILLSSLASMMAFICFYELQLFLFQDRDLAWYATLLFAFFPTAFFFHAPYTDALFALLSISSIWMMVKRKHIAAGLLSFLAGLTRAQGVLLLIPMFVLYVQSHWKEKDFFQWRELFAICIAPLGFFMYMFWRMSSGLPDMFQSYMVFSGARFQDPFSTLINSTIYTIQNPSPFRVIQVLSVVLFLAVLIWMFTHKVFQKHLAILLYSTANWVLIVSKTGIAGAGLQSVNRYVLQIFFVFSGLAFILIKTPKRFQTFVLFLSLIGGLITSTLYALWIFVG